MNKKRNATVLIIIFILQLMIPIGMVAYTSYIDWGLENRAAVYKFKLLSVEWMHPQSVYLQYDYTRYPIDARIKGSYGEVRTGNDGFATVDVTNKRPDGNYIRSLNGKWYSMPSYMHRYELNVPFSEDDFRWLYFVPASQKEDWGWRQTENYFDEAYAEVHIFKGHAVTKAVYIDGRTIEEHIAECVRLGIVNE